MSETRPTDLARDSVYVAVGTGVLVFQRIMVVRRVADQRIREITRETSHRLRSAIGLGL